MKLKIYIFYKEFKYYLAENFEAINFKCKKLQYYCSRVWRNMFEN